ncbi:uncharacterized protein JCM15063_001747 [Sporobolomyces koalae]|uniref:uncharacterized protein n=1 Tax=Sporobolomyces koalae TaxID=500713 RepID=UPI0031815B87
MASSDQAVQLSLPYICVQPSLPAVIAEVADPQSLNAAENAWISFYRPQDSAGPGSSRTFHGRIILREAEQSRAVEIECEQPGAFEVDMLSRAVFRASCAELSISPTRLILPCPSSNVPRPASHGSEETPAPAFYTMPAKGGVTCIAISPDRTRLVVGSRDGYCQVVEIESDPQSRRLTKGKDIALRGHVGDLTHIEFFPSSEVVLTASSDMSLRVFSALDGSCPRVLRGHTRPVTGTCILSSVDGRHKGQQVLSTSLDGTIKLWNVATGDCSRTWTLSKPITALAVITIDQESNGTSSNVLEGRFTLCGHSDGTVSLVSLAPPPSPSLAPFAQVLQTFSTSSRSNKSSIDALAYDRSSGRFATGDRTGFVNVFELSNSTLELSTPAPDDVTPFVSWMRTDRCSILALQWSKRELGSLFVASSDGLPYRARIDVDRSSKSVEVLEEYVGLDCDPCTAIVEDEIEDVVWTTGGKGDGGVRVYRTLTKDEP